MPPSAASSAIRRASGTKACAARCDETSRPPGPAGHSRTSSGTPARTSSKTTSRRVAMRRSSGLARRRRPAHAAPENLSKTMGAAPGAVPGSPRPDRPAVPGRRRQVEHGGVESRVGEGQGVDTACTAWKSRPVARGRARRSMAPGQVRADVAMVAGQVGRSRPVPTPASRTRMARAGRRSGCVAGLPRRRRRWRRRRRERSGV